MSADQLRTDLMRLAVDHGIWQEVGTYRASQFVNAVMGLVDPGQYPILDGPHVFMEYGTTGHCGWIRRHDHDGNGPLRCAQPEDRPIHQEVTDERG